MSTPLAPGNRPEVREKILETLRGGVPFIALAAEANGVNRRTMQTWLELGRHGDERYAEFTEEVYRIRALYMLRLADELSSVDRHTAEAARQKNWILQRLDRTIFDPPKEIIEKIPARTSPEDHANSPMAADPALVAQALNALTPH
jgi:hypothetical protein